MFNKFTTTQRSWLAFELNVLRRLKFDSVVLPFTSEPHLGAYLKRWNVRVLANDLSQSAWTKAVAVIQNNAEKLSDEDVNIILEDAYVPHYRLQSQALRNWFGETDAWWFDNVRQNIEKLSSPFAQAIALTIGMSVGDYVLSFDEETREFRQPLSTVFERLRSIQPEPINNGQNNVCQNKTANDFITENRTDLMFLRLPPPRNQNLRKSLGAAAWREEWLRRKDDFWNDLEMSQAAKLGTLIETKHQYLRLLEETLRTASYIPVWAIAHVEDGFVSTQDIVEIIGHIRRVDTIFTKDFSEFSGTKAVVITA
jgi:adenine-specific DNA methylase